MQHRRGSGVVIEPDIWLASGTISVGGGHGPILFEKSEAGGGGL